MLAHIGPGFTSASRDTRSDLACRDHLVAAAATWAGLKDRSIRLEACCVDTTVALEDESQGLLHRVGFLGQAFHLDEHMLLAATSARGARPSNESATLRQQVGLA